MNLSFSENWPKSMGKWAGQPTYFIQKIWYHLHDVRGFITNFNYGLEYIKKFDRAWDHIEYRDTYPKIHTIREDRNNRWKPGSKIHPVINPRSKDRFQFAPVIECVSVQKVEILDTFVYDPKGLHSYRTKYGLFRCINVDGRSLGINEIDTLARYDGFESIEQFFAWFNKPATYKLIHWTPFKY